MIIVLSCVFFSITLHAQDVQNQKMNEKHDLVKELKMNPEQEKEYLQLREKRISSTKQLHENISALRSEMRIAMKDESSSKEQIFSYIDKISDMKAQIQKERIEFMFGMKEILTPEQFSQMKNIQNKGEVRKHGAKSDSGKKKSLQRKF